MLRTKEYTIRTYTVKWSRTDYEPEVIYSCSGLTASVAFARLMGAIQNSGSVIVRAIEPERSARA